MVKPIYFKFNLYTPNDFIYKYLLLIILLPSQLYGLVEIFISNVINDDLSNNIIYLVGNIF